MPKINGPSPWFRCWSSSTSQDASRLTGRPHRPIEHLMIAGVGALVAAAHDAQRRHGALARGQYRADQQHLSFPPGWGRRCGRCNGQPCYHLGCPPSAGQPR